MKKKIFMFALIFTLCIAACLITDYMQYKWAEKAYALQIDY